MDSYIKQRSTAVPVPEASMHLRVRCHLGAVVLLLNLDVPDSCRLGDDGVDEFGRERQAGEPEEQPQPSSHGGDDGGQVEQEVLLALGLHAGRVVDVHQEAGGHVAGAACTYSTILGNPPFLHC